MIEVNYSTRKRPTCIDLFSGAGGMSLGFLMAGGNPIGAVDIDKDSIETYKKLFPKAKDVFLGDIEEWKPKTIPSGVDVIIGGPPCQGFSLARGLRFVDDPRNHLYKDFVRAVDYYKPSWFVMENVQGITNIGKGIILQQILEDFEAIGYSLEYKVVNMAEHGVPQLRKRAIFVGNNQGKKFEWPEKLHKKKSEKDDLFSVALPRYNSVNEALSDLNLPIGNYFSHRANAQMRGPRNRCAHTEPAYTLRVRGDEFALCEEPAVSAFIPGPAPEEPALFSKPENEIQAYFQHQPPKWIENKAAPIRKKSTEGQILSGTRKLTIREQARLQGFPDWVNFEGTRYSQSRQIGNAVPPIFAYHLFRKIFSFL
jgi:DNA (cytosine-5)-methyltransferase 1